MDVSSNRTSWLDEVWLLTRMDSKKPDGARAGRSISDVWHMAHTSDELCLATGTDPLVHNARLPLPWLSNTL